MLIAIFSDVLTLFNCSGSLFFQVKEEGLAPKLFVEIDFGNVTSRKCYNIRQVLIHHSLALLAVNWLLVMSCLIFLDGLSEARQYT